VHIFHYVDCLLQWWVGEKCPGLCTLFFCDTSDVYFYCYAKNCAFYGFKSYSIVHICHYVNCLLQWMVGGRTGINGIVTSVVVPEPEREHGRAQTHHRHMVVTIVRGRHRRRLLVFCHSVQVSCCCILTVHKRQRLYRAPRDQSITVWS